MRVLLDGTFLFFRALHSVPEGVTDSQGRESNGVLGFADSALRLLAPTYGKVDEALIAFDESLGTGFRHRLYPEYKANRPPPDDNIRFQLGACQRFCDALALPWQASSEYEADDLIASAAASAAGPVRIVSRDKDLKQLLSNRVSMWDPVSRVTHDRESFESDFGFAPTRFPDYQALVGDSSDNIPGVLGIGAKTAQVLIAAYGSLESVLASPARWTDDGVKLRGAARIAERLGDQGERALAMRQILRLSTEAEPPPSGFTTVAPALDAALASLNELGLGRLEGSLRRYVDASR